LPPLAPRWAFARAAELRLADEPAAAASAQTTHSQAPLAAQRTNRSCTELRAL